MNLPRPLESFFFKQVGARGFGLMRISWAFFTGAYMLMQWKDVAYYYSNAGIFPDSLEWIFARSHYRFTVLEWVQDPVGVFALYLILLTTLFCMLIGLWPRLMTIASVLLIFTFHERNGMVLGGGDTLLRNIGFILMIAPGIEAFSVSRLSLQWEHWKKTRTFLPPVTMPIWPWRLLLWQMIVLYTTSLWYKLLGTMWMNGTAVEATFHHPVYARFSPRVMNHLLSIAGIGDYLALFWQGAWALFIIPRNLLNLLPKRLRPIAFRRWMLFGGVLFHGGILLLMDAGVFSFAVFTAYFGLLLDEDVEWMKSFVNKVTGYRLQVTSSETRNSKLETSQSPTILYDGLCGLCLRSMFSFQMLDWLGRIRYVNFRDADARKKEAPDVTEKTLDKAMHVKMPNGIYKTGFDGFRALSWHIPVLWLFAPFLYVPGVAFVGRRIYAKVAKNRVKCDHESCTL